MQKERPIFIHYHIQKLDWEPQIDVSNEHPSGPASWAPAADPSSCHILPPALGFGSNICQPLGYFLKRLSIGQPAGWSFKRTHAIPDKNPSECGSEALRVGGRGGEELGQAQ